MWGITRVLFLLAFFTFPSFAFAMSYSPINADVDVDSGSSSATSFTFFHNEDVVQAYIVRLYSAQVGNGPDEVSFSNLTPEVLSWLHVSEDEFVLDPGEVKELTLSVTIPVESDPQIQIIAMQVIEIASENGTIEALSGVSPLIFLTVGDLPGSAELKSFSASKTITSSLPVSFLADIKNTGLRVVQPSGVIVLRNIFGETIEVLELNEGGGRIVSDLGRSFSVDWGDTQKESGFFNGLSYELSNFMIGWVSAELSVAPWEGGEDIHQKITLFFFPWRTLLSFVLIVAVLFGLSRLSKR